MTIVIVALSAFLLSMGLTGLARWIALRSSLVDIPNERSSHTVPTPSGGGVAIAITVLLLAGVVSVVENMSLPLLLAVSVAGSLVAVIGLLDDYRNVPIVVRLLVQVASFLLAIYWLEWDPIFRIASALEIGGVPAKALSVLLAVWGLNLFNFMDGIDGIAASEASFVAFAGASMSYYLSFETSLAWALLASACLGFLVWNWAPAKIFMGDVGSSFLGFLLVILLARTIQDGSISVWTASILIAPFVVDATVTLLRRAARGEVWYRAHKSHAYQQLARSWGSHARVVIALIVINIAIVLPIGLLSVWFPASAPLVCIGIYALLVAGVLTLGAGAESGEPS